MKVVRKVQGMVKKSFKEQISKCISDNDYHLEGLNLDFNLTDNQIEVLEGDILEIKHDRVYYMVYLSCYKNSVSISL